MSDLDEYASRGKAMRERDAQREPRKARPRRRLSDKERRIRDALSGDTSLIALLVSGLGVGGAAALYAVLHPRWPSPGAEIACALLAAAVLVGGFLAWSRARDRHAERERQWLRALPFASDWAEYQRALGVGRFTTTVRVRAKFRADIERDERTRLGDAARGLVGRCAATCSARALELTTSEPLKTHFRGNGDRDSRYSNVGVHAWVRAVLQALERIHLEQAIETVEIELR